MGRGALGWTPKRVEEGAKEQVWTPLLAELLGVQTPRALSLCHCLQLPQKPRPVGVQTQVGARLREGVPLCEALQSLPAPHF